MSDAVAVAPVEMPEELTDASSGPFVVPQAAVVPPHPVVLHRPGSVLDAKLRKSSPGKAGLAIFILVLLAGLAYIVTRVTADLQTVHPTSILPFIELGIALLVALGFEFVNGFNDTANAVATVIYTHSLDPHIAVVWSGCWNFLGVLTASGAVAYTIVNLLPVGLILKVSTGSGFAMVFALLFAAIIWNLMTWFYGLPISSSHTMIGSIIGVGIMNQILLGRSGISGIDWEQARKIFKTLLISPVVGFAGAALLFLLLKAFVHDKRLYETPKDGQPPPPFIRALLILTCTGVSFFHGSNDGQKGMGLIMLILIGTVPTAYALNHTFGPNQVQTFIVASEAAIHSLEPTAPPATTPAVANPSAELEAFVSSHQYKPTTAVALQQMASTIEREAAEYKTLAAVPAAMQANVRNQMYLESESLRLLPKFGPTITSSDAAVLTTYRAQLDKSTRFIPTWVKVAVALALGMGTMIGWRRIVITVGERIGKAHLTYAQGLTAELVAMCTIWAAGTYGLPVSTTHVLSSGVAGTMAANKSGLQRSTIRNIAMAWVFTLPAAACLSAVLYWLFSKAA